MFIMWGTSGFEKDLGSTNIRRECPRCNNYVTMRGVKIGRKFSLYRIPLITYTSSQYFMCPVCRAAEETTKEEMASALQS